MPSKTAIELRPVASSNIDWVQNNWIISFWKLMVNSSILLWLITERSGAGVQILVDLVELQDWKPGVQIRIDIFE